MSGAIDRIVLRDGDVSVTLLTVGCVTQDWQVPLDGNPVPVVLGYREVDAYRDNPAYLGAIVGRVANRIANARFVLDGQPCRLPPNDGPHHLHGGPGGLSHAIWTADRDGDRAVRFRYRSPHGAGGYPGMVDFQVTVTLDGATLSYRMQAVPDRPTPISLAQHNYYALGPGPIWGQRLRIAADGCTPAGPDLIPTGEIAALNGQVQDFRASRTLTRAEHGGAGLDLNYVLRDGAGPVARLDHPDRLCLELETDQPGLQLYTATHLDRFAAPLPGQTHAPFHALCLEPQGFPNAVNTPGFPGIIATPDRPYSQMTRITIRPRPEG